VKKAPTRCLPRGAPSTSSVNRNHQQPRLTDEVVPAQASVPRRSGADNNISGGGNILAQPITIAKFWRNRHRRETVVLRLREYEGSPLVDLRIFDTGNDGISRPTKHGVSLSVKRLPALADAFASAYREAVRQGLLGGSSSTNQSGG
jgi:hypothetical protein